MAITLLVIAIVLLVVAAAPDLTRLRDFAWFETYLSWLDRKLSPNGFWSGIGGVALVVLAPVGLLAWLMSWANDVAFGVFGLLLSLIGLFYLLGPRDLGEDLTELSHSFDTQSRLRAQQLFGVDTDYAQSANQLLQPVLTAALKRHFAPIFWFVALGLPGALLYRAAQLMADDAALRRFLPEGLVASAKACEALLAWIPAQLMCLSLALASDFDAVARAWSEHHERDADARRFGWLDLNMGFLANTMKACIDIDDVDELTNEHAQTSADIAPLQHVQQLLSRITLAWLVGIAVLVLASYLA